MTTMWKTLHQLAAPPRLYQICGRLVPWLAAAGIIALATGWVRGFGFAPADYQQGEGYRIMYLHVPAVPSGQWVSMRRWRWRRLPGWSGR